MLSGIAIINTGYLDNTNDKLLLNVKLKGIARIIYRGLSYCFPHQNQRYTKFKFDYESPLTYSDHLNRLNLLSFSHLCQLYKCIQDPCSLPPDSRPIHFRNDQRYTRQSPGYLFFTNLAQISGQEEV